MSKKRRTKKTNRTSRKQIQRDISTISKFRKLLYERSIHPDLDNKFRNLEHLLDDRRYFRPEIFKDAKKFDGRPSPLIEYPAEKPYKSAVMSFADPRNTVVCKRRKDRRKALFSAGSIGGGRKVSKYRKRTEFSDVRCK